MKERKVNGRQKMERGLKETKEEGKKWRIERGEREKKKGEKKGK